MSNSLFKEVRDNISDSSRNFIDNSFNIVERILSILEKKKISQKQLAQKLNKSELEISKMLSPGHNLTLRSISKIEMALKEKIIFTSTQSKNKNLKEHLEFV